MPTQTPSQTDIPLLHSIPSEDGDVTTGGYKLIELPSELLSLLDRDDPPTYASLFPYSPLFPPSSSLCFLKLQFTISVRSSSLMNPTLPLRTGNLTFLSLLLHPTLPSATLTVSSAPPRSYALKQKNTSNALIILSLTTTTTEAACSSLESDNRDPSTQQQQHIPLTAPAFVITCTIHETIELVPVLAPGTMNNNENTSVAVTGAVSMAPRGKWHEKFARDR